MLLSSLFFIYRMLDLTTVTPLATGFPPRVKGCALQGSIFFGSVGKLDGQIDPVRMGELDVLVLDMHDVINIDTTGIDWLQGLFRALARQDTVLVICGMREQPASLLQRSGLAGMLGQDNQCVDLSAALLRVHEIQSGHE